MPAAVITASASVVVAVLVFVLNQRAVRAADRRRAKLDRIAEQLRLLYGPLHMLVDVNEDLWRRLRETTLPGQQRRRAAEPIAEDRSRQWRIIVGEALMPANRRMRDLIVQHADLLVEIEMPEPLREFCAHVAAYEILLAPDSDRAGPPLVHHPGAPYSDYVRAAYLSLKTEQARLLQSSGVRGSL